MQYCTTECMHRKCITAQQLIICFPSNLILPHHRCRKTVTVSPASCLQRQVRAAISLFQKCMRVVIVGPAWMTVSFGAWAWCDTGPNSVLPVCIIGRMSVSEGA